MIGLALVLFVTVYASGLRASSAQIIDRTFIGDFTIESQDGFSPIPAASARAAAVVPDVLAVSSLKTATARLGAAKRVTAAGIDAATIGQVYRFEWINGSQGTLDDLTSGDVIVERDTARTAHVSVGDHVKVTTETGLAPDGHGPRDLQGPGAAAWIRAAPRRVRSALSPTASAGGVRQARARSRPRRRVSRADATR